MKGTHMKSLLAGLALALLVGCTVGQQQMVTTLTDDAKRACTQQAVFNTVAGAAAVFGPQIAAGAAIASAAVGVACTWINK
jgi:outer membrane biogenesis lipoprotein LolB